MLDYIKNVIVPYVIRVREELQLAPDHAALAIYAAFKGQLTDRVFQFLEENNILMVTVPANCTDCLQPMEISLNKSVKDFLRHEFQVWYSEKVIATLEEESEEDHGPVNLTSAAMKTVGGSGLSECLNMYSKTLPLL